MGREIGDYQPLDFSGTFAADLSDVKAACWLLVDAWLDVLINDVYGRWVDR